MENLRKPSKAISFFHITDGISNTFLVGEKRLNMGLLGQPQIDDNEGFACGWDQDIVRWVGGLPQPDYSDSTNTAGGGGLFGSSHTSGFNMVFADGTVRFIRYSIDPTLWWTLGTRNDGKVANPGDV